MDVGAPTPVEVARRGAPTIGGGRLPRARRAGVEEVGHVRVRLGQGDFVGVDDARAVGVAATREAGRQAPPRGRADEAVDRQAELGLEVAHRGFGVRDRRIRRR